MDSIVLGMVQHSIPYIQDQVRSNKLHIYYVGGKALGYPEAHDKHILRVVHGNTLVHKWDMHYPERIDVKFELHAVPIRKMTGMFTGLGKLAPLGELVHTGNHKTSDIVARYTGSAEYAEVLKKKEAFSTTYFTRTEDIGYFYRHMYAHLVALRTHLEGVVGVGEAVPLLSLASQYSATAHNSIQAMIGLNGQVHFDEFAPLAIEAIKAEGIEVIGPY